MTLPQSKPNPNKKGHDPLCSKRRGRRSCFRRRVFRNTRKRKDRHGHVQPIFAYPNNLQQNLAFLDPCSRVDSWSMCDEKNTPQRCSHTHIGFCLFSRRWHSFFCAGRLLRTETVVVCFLFSRSVAIVKWLTGVQHTSPFSCFG